MSERTVISVIAGDREQSRLGRGADTRVDSEMGSRRIRKKQCGTIELHIIERTRIRQCARDEIRESENHELTADGRTGSLGTDGGITTF